MLRLRVQLFDEVMSGWSSRHTPSILDSRPRNTAASGNLAFTTSQASTPKLYTSSLSMHETVGGGKIGSGNCSHKHK